MERDDRPSEENHRRPLWGGRSDPSPDHGTAFDIAGKNLADPTSFISAVFECIDILQRRNDFGERNKNPLRKITAEVLKNVEDERIDDTIDTR